MLHKLSALPHLSNFRTKLQSRFRELFTDGTTEETRKFHTGSNKKAKNFGLKLLNGSPKFPYKFKEIISLTLPYVELIM